MRYYRKVMFVFGTLYGDLAKRLTGLHNDHHFDVYELLTYNCRVPRLDLYREVRLHHLWARNVCLGTSTVQPGWHIPQQIHSINKEHVNTTSHTDLLQLLNSLTLVLPKQRHRQLMPLLGVVYREMSIIQENFQPVMPAMSRLNGLSRMNLGSTLLSDHYLMALGNSGVLDSGELLWC